MADICGATFGDEASEATELDRYNQEDLADAIPDEPWHIAFVQWVQQHFATVEFFTAEPKIRWCPTWWEHREVVERLKALWASYLVADLAEDAEAASAMSDWWLHHWDPHREILFHDKGPFRNCDLEHGHLWSCGDRRVFPVPEMPPRAWNPLP